MHRPVYVQCASVALVASTRLASSRALGTSLSGTKPKPGDSPAFKSSYHPRHNSGLAVSNSNYLDSVMESPLLDDGTG